MHCGFATATVDNLVATQMFDSLILKDSATGEYKPGLATSWEYEDDTTLVFTLRQDVQYHNGETMTAEDVKFSIETVRDSSYAVTLTHFIDTVEVRDDSTVAVNFLYAYGPAIECFAQNSLAIFPQAAYEEDPDGFKRNPVGTGAYEFVEWKTGASISMTAFDGYWGEAPSIQDVEFVIYNNGATSAALALENGELDVITTVASSDNARLMEADGLYFDSTEGSVVTFIMFNTREDSVFNDENLRLAVAHAIDKESVMIGAVEGYGSLAVCNVPSYVNGIDDTYVPPQYDPELAKEYLAKAGYPDGLDLTIPVSGVDSYLIPLEIVQDQLAQVGINITIDKRDSNAWFEDIFRTGDYPFQMCTFSTSVPDIDYYYEMYVSDGKENFSGLNHPDLDEAYKLSRSTSDEALREEYINDVVEVLAEQAIIVPIYQTDKAVCANANLVGVVADCEGIYTVADWSWADIAE